MTPIDFLQIVWPAGGWYCIAIPKNGVYTHKVFKTISEAAAFADKARLLGDVYFATHALKEDRVWNAKNSKWSFRTRANMRCSRVFFLDLDVKKDAYTNRDEAIADLKRFCRETGLPRPMLVSSGFGVHVYWVIEEELASTDVWVTHASRLKQLTHHHQLKADPVRTADPTSILRVAGTFNRKHGGSRPVQTLATTTPIPLAEWSRLLLAALDAADLPPTQTKAAAPDDHGLGENTRREFTGPAPSIEALEKSCGQMARILGEQGKSSEPEWYWGDVGVVKFTKDGPANVHKVSSGDPRYTYAETQAKIDQWTTDPTTCSKLEEISGVQHAHICKACPYYTQNQSPIRIARLMDTAPPPVVIVSIDTNVQITTTIPEPPAPYQLRNDGSIAILTAGKDDKTFPVEIYPYQMYPVSRSSNSQHETEQHAWRVHLPHKAEPVDFTIEASTFVDEKALAARLGNHGIWPKKISLLRDFMSAYIQKLQKEQPPAVQHNQLGWIEDHTKFIFPTKMLTPGGGVEKASLSKQALVTKDFVCKKGTLEKQVDLLHFYDNPAYVAHQFYILCSLGAAVFFATGKHGVIVHATGETGASKSTALYAAASMWGPPFQYVLNATGEGATNLYRASRRELLSNLPLCLDEITHIAADVAKTMAMNATQMGPRGRLQNDGTPKAGNTSERSSMTLTTANSSLHGLLQVDNTAGTASSIRVFEIHFRKLLVHKPWEADAFLRGLTENYGHIGEQLIRFAVDHQKEVVDRVVAVLEQLGVKASMRQEERFWFSAAASSLVTGGIASRQGYLGWDLGYMTNWLFRNQLPQLRGTIADETHNASALNALTNYLEYIHGDMLKTRRYPGNPHPGIIQAPRGEMAAHYEMENQCIYILKDNFKRWCQRRGQYALPILKDLNAKGVATNLHIQHTLGDGTDYAKSKSTCFVVDLAHPSIAAAVQLTVIQGGLVGTP